MGSTIIDVNEGLENFLFLGLGSCKFFYEVRDCAHYFVGRSDIKNPIKLFFRDTSLKVCTGEGFQKCHYFKNQVLRKVTKVFILLSIIILAFEWCFTFVFTTKTLVLRAIFRKHLFLQRGVCEYFLIYVHVFSCPCLNADVRRHF